MTALPERKAPSKEPGQVMYEAAGGNWDILTRESKELLAAAERAVLEHYGIPQLRAERDVAVMRKLANPGDLAFETHLLVTKLREWVDQVECVLAAFNLESLDELEGYLERLAAERKEAVMRAETAEAALIQAQAEYDEDSGAQWARADVAEAEAARQRTRAERAERERDEAHDRIAKLEPTDREIRAEAAELLLCQPDSAIATSYLLGFRAGRARVDEKGDAR